MVFSAWNPIFESSNVECGRTPATELYANWYLTVLRLRARLSRSRPNIFGELSYIRHRAKSNGWHTWTRRNCCWRTVFRRCSHYRNVSVLFTYENAKTWQRTRKTNGNNSPAHLQGEQSVVVCLGGGFSSRSSWYSIYHPSGRRKELALGLNYCVVNSTWENARLYEHQPRQTSKITVLFARSSRGRKMRKEEDEEDEEEGLTGESAYPNSMPNNSYA